MGQDIDLKKKKKGRKNKKPGFLSQFPLLAFLESQDLR